MKAASKPSYFTFLNVAVLLVLVWIVFLYYYHHNSLHEAERAVAALRGNNLQNLLQQVESLTEEELKALRALVHPAGPSGVVTKPVSVAMAPKPANPVVQTYKEPDSSYHIAFSTDCTFFQDWQTLLIFHSATMVKQEGRITRIASGCTEEKKAELTDLYKKLYPQYSVHFTPDFKTDGKTKKKYEFYNKPYGVQHWLTHAEPPINSGTVINIIDPDMVILRPMTAQIRGNPANIYMNRFDPQTDTVPEKVQKGSPVAQLYGLGAPWAIDGHKHFNRTEICGEGSPCLKTAVGFGEQHYR